MICIYDCICLFLCVYMGMQTALRNSSTILGLPVMSASLCQVFQRLEQMNAGKRELRGDAAVEARPSQSQSRPEHELPPAACFLMGQGELPYEQGVRSAGTVCTYGGQHGC